MQLRGIQSNFFAFETQIRPKYGRLKVGASQISSRVPPYGILPQDQLGNDLFTALGCDVHVFFFVCWLPIVLVRGGESLRTGQKSTRRAVLNLHVLRPPAARGRCPLFVFTIVFLSRLRVASLGFRENFPRYGNRVIRELF